MKKITISAEELKAINNALALFSSSENSIQFEFGITDSSQAEHENEICSSATIVNGGMQLKKTFYVPMPSDFMPEELYATFFVKSNDFITYSNGLLSFNEEVCMEIGNNLTMRVGDIAKKCLELIPEENADALLPEEYSKAFVACTLATDKFLAFARKGCYLFDDKDTRNTMDRVKVSIEGTTITGYSTNGFIVATSRMNDCKVKFLHENLAMFLLAKKRDGMPADKRDSFKSAVKEALEKNTLLEFAENEGINCNAFEFSLLSASFHALKKVVAGTKMFQLVVTDNYCYVNTGDMMAVFTLGSTVPTIYSSISAWQGVDVSARVVVDGPSLLNGISLLTLDNDSKNPVHVSLQDGNLSLVKNDASVRCSLVESDGADNADIYINGSYLKQALSSLDNGNICLTFRTGRTPVELRNGALSDSSDALAFVLLVNKQ